MTGHDLLVDPERLLRIRFLDASGIEQQVVALVCAYIPAHGADGAASVAVEIIVDPAMQNPGVAYYCDPQRLRHHVIPPKHLRGVQPYSASGGGAAVAP